MGNGVGMFLMGRERRSEKEEEKGGRK